MNELDLWLLSTAPELVKQAAGIPMDAPELASGRVRRGEAEGRRWGRNVGTVAGTALGAALAHRAPTAGGIIARLAPSVVGGRVGGSALGATVGEHKARKQVAERMKGEEGQAYLREREGLQQARRRMLAGEGTGQDVSAQRKRFQAARALAQEALAKESAEKTAQPGGPNVYQQAMSPIQLSEYEQARSHGRADVKARGRTQLKGRIMGAGTGAALGTLRGGSRGAVIGALGGALVGHGLGSMGTARPTARDLRRAEGLARIRKAKLLQRQGYIGRRQRQATVQDVTRQR